ncbi:MAG: DUF6364 family protein [Cyclonatronaceae bacterium]
MKDKLTLRVEKSLIKEAKKQARIHGTSVSQMVSDYFKALQIKKEEDKPEKLPPKTASLSGILKKNVDKDDYKKHIEDKYLL